MRSSQTITYTGHRVCRRARASRAASARSRVRPRTVNLDDVAKLVHRLAPPSARSLSRGLAHLSLRIIIPGGHPAGREGVSRRCRRWKRGRYDRVDASRSRRSSPRAVTSRTPPRRHARLGTSPRRHAVTPSVAMGSPRPDPPTRDARAGLPSRQGAGPHLLSPGAPALGRAAAANRPRTAGAASSGREAPPTALLEGPISPVNRAPSR